jgi:hypothetical protein
MSKTVDPQTRPSLPHTLPNLQALCKGIDFCLCSTLEESNIVMPSSWSGYPRRRRCLCSPVVQQITVRRSSHRRDPSPLGPADPGPYASYASLVNVRKNGQRSTRPGLQTTAAQNSSRSEASRMTKSNPAIPGDRHISLRPSIFTNLAQNQPVSCKEIYAFLNF